jgi:urease accessory protein
MGEWGNGVMPQQDDGRSRSFHYAIPPSRHHPIDSRPLSAIGRRARLDLVFEYRRGRTVLAEAYAEPPFRVGRALDAGPYAYVILACTGPGVFGGDALEQRIRVARGARVLLVSQAAQQVHPTGAADAATVESRFEVEPDGELDCFWDPIIPFAGARLVQRIDLQSAAGSRLFWSDALMAGRTGHGESWRFDDLAHELRFHVDGRLMYLERYRLTPRSRPVDRTWIAGNAQYVGTTLVHGPQATAENAGRLQQQLSAIGGDLRGGVDCVAPNLLVGRVLAVRGPQFAAARAMFRQAFGRPDRRI